MTSLFFTSYVHFRANMEIDTQIHSNLNNNVPIRRVIEPYFQDLSYFFFNMRLIWVILTSWGRPRIWIQVGVFENSRLLIMGMSSHSCKMSHMFLNNHWLPFSMRLWSSLFFIVIRKVVSFTSLTIRFLDYTKYLTEHFEKTFYEWVFQLQFSPVNWL